MTLEEALGGGESNMAGLVWSAATAFALLQYGQGAPSFSVVLHNGRNFWKPGRWLLPGRNSQELPEDVARSLRGDDLDRALKDITIAISSEPKRPDLLVLRALIGLGREMPHVFPGFPRFLAASLGVQKDLEEALRLAPDHVWARMVFGILEYQRRRFHAAEPHFTRVVALRPRWAWGRIMRADVIYYLRQVDEAKAEFDRAARLDPKNSWAFALLGRAKNLTRDPSMQKDLDRSIKLEPKTAWLYAWRGIAKLAITRDPTALKDFEAAKKLDRDYDRIFAWRASALIKEGRPREAIKDLEHALSLNPHLDITLYSLGRALFMTGRKREAVDAIKKAAAASHQSIWIYNWGDWNHQNHARRETMEDLDRSVAAAPRAAWAWAWRGQTKLALLDFPGALSDLDRAIALDSGFAYSLAWRAEANRRMGRPRKAARDLERALALDPSCVWAWAWRGRLRFDQGRIKEAESDFSKAISLNRRIALAYIWRFEARRKLGRDREALADVEAAIEFYPTWKWLWVWKARLLEAAGNLKGALPCLEEAAKLAPRAETFTLLSRLKLLLKDRTGARGDLVAALAQDPRSPLLARLEKGRGPLFRRFLSAEGWDLAADFASLEPNSPSDEAAWVCYDGYEDGAAPIRSGIRRVRQARLVEALADFDAALKIDPKDFGALLIKADCLLKVHPPRLEEAQALATRCIELRPESREARLLRHQARRQAGDWAGALEDLRAARSEQDLRVALEAARLLLRSGRIEEAEREADGVLALDLVDQGANRLKADILIGSGRFKEAESAARGMLMLMPGLSWPRLTVARALFFRGRPVDALAESSRALRGAASVGYAAHVWRAIFLAALGRNQAALAGVARALELNPRCAWGLMVRSELRRRGGDVDGSADDLRLAARFDAHFTGSELFVPQNDWREAPAWALAWRGALASSEAQLRAAVEREPGLYWGWAWLGHALGRAGKKGEALTCFDQCLAIAPRYHEALVWRGRALLEAGRDAEAARDFGAALALDGSAAYAYIGRAVARGRLGDLAGQKEDLRRGQELAPGLFDAHSARLVAA